MEIEYRKFLHSLRTGQIHDFVWIMVGGVKWMLLPRKMLSFMKYFDAHSVDAPANNGPIYVPYAYKEFKALVNFMFDPDGGLDKVHYRTWRIFFQASNISNNHMEHVPETLRIPIQKITIKTTDGHTYSTSSSILNENHVKNGIDHLFNISEYFRNLFKYNVAQSLQIEIEQDDYPLILILNNRMAELAEKFTEDKVNAVVAKYQVKFYPCMNCRSTEYCEHRTFVNTMCGCNVTTSEKCKLVPTKGKTCTICQATHYDHTNGDNCKKHNCAYAGCNSKKESDNGGYCLKHGCEHGKLSVSEKMCVSHFCGRWVKARWCYCTNRLPCNLHE